MKALRLQSWVFIGTALLVSWIHVWIGIPQGEVSLLVLLLAIVVLGIPHGALDTLYAGRVFGVRRLWQWVLFSAAYLAPVVAVLLFWPEWPFFFLTLFLVVSISHFAGDPEPGCPVWLRMLYGGAPVVLPALLHGSEVEILLGSLVASGIAADVRMVLSFLAWPWLLIFATGALAYGRQRRQASLEMVAVGALCSLAPPLVSFTLFFCCMHSARHILRSLDGNTGQAVLAGVPPMIGTLVILAVYWDSAKGAAMEPRLVKTVFVGLAALTFPHVMLVDGFYRWGKGLWSGPGSRSSGDLPEAGLKHDLLP